MFQAVSSFFGAPQQRQGSMTAQSLHDFEVSDIEGNRLALSQYKGQVVLVVNLASACGLTPQYAELQKLQDRYHARGFTVLGFPCNQFGGQEPGSNSEIRKFATSKYNVTFPLMSKIDVNGDDADPVFVFLKESKGEIFGSGIKWNFSKFLVGKDGKVVQRYAPTTSPAVVATDIEKLLATP